MYKSRRIVVRNENRSERGEVSEKWRVKSEEWRVKSEEWKVNRGQWTLIIDHWYWHEVFCVRCRGDLQIALCCCVRFFLKFTHVFNCPHVGGLIAISPYACVFWTFANIDVNTCKYTCKYTEKHHGHGVSMFAHVVGAICKSPLCCCVRFFLESLTLQIRPCYKFAHVFNCPPCGGANCN